MAQKRIQETSVIRLMEKINKETRTMEEEEIVGSMVQKDAKKVTVRFESIPSGA